MIKKRQNRITYRKISSPNAGDGDTTLIKRTQNTSLHSHEYTI